MEPATEEEVVALKGFRDRITDLKLSEEDASNKNLLRWLRARSLNLAAAEEMFRKRLHWNVEYGIEDIFNWKPPPEIVEGYPYTVSGFDFKGSLVAVVPFGSWDVPIAISLGMKQEYIRYCIQHFERAWSLVIKKGRGQKYYDIPIVIFDLEGLNLRKVTAMSAVDACITLARYYEAYYPETIKLAIAFNAPAIFSIAWGLIKPFISERTAAKLRVYGSKAEEWKAVLLDYIPEDQLPKKYGGTADNSTDMLIVYAAKDDITCEVNMNDNNKVSSTEL